MKLCNVPQDLLAKQAIIDTIPSIVHLGIIVTVIVAAYYFVYHIKNDIEAKDLIPFAFALIVITIVGCGFGAGILREIVTAIANPEYAAMVKFAAECGVK